MATYSGPLNVLTDSSGSVIPVSINPADVPAGGLIIDVSNVQNPPSGTFGYIAGITVDASAANNAVGLISLSFDGGYNLVRNVNSGTQVFRVSGPILRVTIQKLAWTTGQINIVLWNSAPSNEVMASLSINATGSVTISGTPTVQIAPGQTVSITAGNVNVGTVTGTVSIEPGAHNIATTFAGAADINGAGTFTKGILGNTTVGTIRSIFINAANVINFRSGSVYIVVAIQDASGHIHTYAQGWLGITTTEVPFVTVLMLSMLAVPFNTGLDMVVTMFGGTVIVDNAFTLQCVIGWN